MIDSGGQITDMVGGKFNDRIYVAVKTGTTTGNIQVIDTTMDKAIATIDLGGVPQGVAFDDNSSTIYATVGDCTGTTGKVVLMDGTTNTVKTTVTTTAGFQPGITFASGVYATPCGATAVRQYDMNTGMATSKMFTFAGTQVALSSDDVAPALFWFGNANGMASFTEFNIFTGMATTTAYPGTAVAVSGVLGPNPQAAIATQSPDTAQLVDPVNLQLQPGARVYDVQYAIQPPSLPVIWVQYCLMTNHWVDTFDLSGTLLRREGPVADLRCKSTRLMLISRMVAKSNGKDLYFTEPSDPNDQTYHVSLGLL